MKTGEAAGIVEVPFQYGICLRCGKDVERDGPAGRWTDQYGRDRCRADWDDGECDVTEVRDGIRLHKLVGIQVATVTIIAADGSVLAEQQVPEGTNYEEFFAGPEVAAGFRVSCRAVTYPAAVTDDEEAAYWASKER